MNMINGEIINTQKSIVEINNEIEVLKNKIQAYINAGNSGDKVFMLNILPEIIEKLTSTVKEVTVWKIHLAKNLR